MIKILVYVSLLGCTLGPATGAVAEEPAPNPGTALVTGSDRGLGLALTEEFAQRGWRVIATCRDPAKATELSTYAQGHPAVSIEKLDVSDNAAIDALVVRLKGRPIDVLFKNAGVTGSLDGQSLAKLAPDDFDRVLRVNSYAPLRVSAAFLDLVASSTQRKIVGMSSGYGSVSMAPRIAAAGYPSAYYYAMSKAALNMGLREFAFEAVPRRVTTVLIAPGAVDTDMQREVRGFMAGQGKPIKSSVLTAAQSAHAMVVTIENLKPDQNGKFLNYDGTEIPW